MLVAGAAAAPRLAHHGPPPPLVQGESCDEQKVEAALTAAFEGADEEIVGKAIERWVGVFWVVVVFVCGCVGGWGVGGWGG